MQQSTEKRECQTSAPAVSARRAHVVRRLKLARQLIEEHYDQTLALADLAAAAFMSEAHFVRQFRDEFGVTPYRCLTDRRLRAACRLLERTAMPVTEIVVATGFGNRSAFSRLFKSRLGVSPLAWRRLSRRHRRPTVARRGVLPAAAALLLVLTPLWAQEGDAPPPPPPCATDAHRAFDFWVGTWEVYANDQLAGRNIIRKRHGDCVLEENWQSAQGSFSGSSLNIYDAANDRWHQSWADSSGTLLELDGGVQNGRMVLSGERPAQDGNGMVTHRITWTPNEDGTVRQQWEASRDGSEWQALFDGVYRKATD
ncbi:MAG: AraC family transcriptional regulator [Pseudomonadota bacterium]